jgi:acetyl esterase/lipase
MIIRMKNNFSAALSAIFLIVTVLQTCQSRAAPFGNQTNQAQPKWRDLAYGELGPREKLDIYLPDEGQDPFPVIIHIHGGAWMMGWKSADASIEGLKRGYAVVAVGYSLSQEAKFPRQIYEIKAAIRWLRANAEKYKLNPDKFAVWGESSGGHLAALAGTSGDVNDLEDLSMGDPNQSSRVQAVVDLFGPIDFIALARQQKEAGLNNPFISDPNTCPEARLLGAPIEKVPDLAKKALPSTFISKDDPPFFIQHGKKDDLIPYQQSVDFGEKLAEALGKDKVQLELLEGVGHGGPAFSATENLDKIFKFLDKYLKDENPNK